MFTIQDNYTIFLLDYISKINSVTEEFKNDKISKEEFLKQIQEIETTFY